MGKLIILCGNIVSDEILSLGDAIVLPTNPMMRCGGGVSGAIFKKAGVGVLEQYCETSFGISYNNPGVNEMRATDVRITPGFALPCKIIFAQGPKRWEYDNIDQALMLLKKTYENVLDASIVQGFKSVLIPALGTGIYGFTHAETAETVIRLLQTFASSHDTTLIFVVFDKGSKDIYDRYIDKE